MPQQKKFIVNRAPKNYIQTDGSQLSRKRYFIRVEDLQKQYHQAVLRMGGNASGRGAVVTVQSKGHFIKGIR